MKENAAVFMVEYGLPESTRNEKGKIEAVEFAGRVEILEESGFLYLRAAGGSTGTGKATGGGKLLKGPEANAIREKHNRPAAGIHANTINFFLH